MPIIDVQPQRCIPDSGGLRLHVVACRVIEDELRAAASASAAEVAFTWLEQGLHNEPDRLREALRHAVDDAERSPGDAVVLGYGLCSRGIEGVTTRTRPMVVPRAHDCITLLLGCRHRYADYTAAHPGTYWYSPGWNRCHTPPGPERRQALLDRYTRAFGEDNAAYLVEVEQGWMTAYNRATYVHLSVGATDGDRAYTRRCADWLGWDYDEQAGDPGLLRALLAGDWDDDRFLVLPAGHTPRVVTDGRVIEAAAADAHGAAG